MPLVFSLKTNPQRSVTDCSQAPENSPQSTSHGGAKDDKSGSCFMPPTGAEEFHITWKDGYITTENREKENASTTPLRLWDASWPRADVNKTVQQRTEDSRTADCIMGRSDRTGSPVTILQQKHFLTQAEAKALTR